MQGVKQAYHARGYQLYIYTLTITTMERYGNGDSQNRLQTSVAAFGEVMIIATETHRTLHVDEFYYKFTSRRFVPLTSQNGDVDIRLMIKQAPDSAKPVFNLARIE